MQPPFVAKLPALSREYSVARQRRTAAILGSVNALLFIVQTVAVVFSYGHTFLWPVFLALAVSFLGSSVTWFVSYRKLSAGSVQVHG